MENDPGKLRHLKKMFYCDYNMILTELKKLMSYRLIRERNEEWIPY